MLPLNTCMSCKLACWILSYVDICKHACLNVNMQKILTCKKLATCRNSQHAEMSTFETCMLTIKHARYFATMLTCVFLKHACFECKMSKKRMSTYSPLFWCAHSTALFPAHDEHCASFSVSTTNVYRSNDHRVRKRKSDARRQPRRECGRVWQLLWPLTGAVLEDGPLTMARQAWCRGSRSPRPRKTLIAACAPPTATVWRSILMSPRGLWLAYPLPCRGYWIEYQ